MINTRQIALAGYDGLRYCFASWSRLAACSSGAFALFCTLVIVYRLYFHPLAKYPGPLLARITTLYGAYHGWKGDFATVLYECHEKYGDCVRWNPNYLIVNSADAFQGMSPFCL